MRLQEIKQIILMCFTSYVSVGAGIRDWGLFSSGLFAMARYWPGVFF